MNFIDPIAEVLLFFLAAVSTKLFWLLVVILINLVLGLWVAIFIRKDFSWAYVTDFWIKNIGRLLGWLAAEILAFIPAEFLAGVPGAELLTDNFGTLVFVFLMGQIVIGSIFGHLMALGILPNEGSRLSPSRIGTKNSRRNNKR